MTSFYEAQVRGLCDEHTKEQLAEMVLNFKKTLKMCVDDNESLRKEISTLQYLIAKYEVDKEGLK